MDRSDTQSKIAPALVMAIGALKNPPTDGLNPHFKSKFATLAGILDATRPVLTSFGLCAMQDSSGSVTIIHESGEWIEFPGMLLTPSKNDPQGHVAALTYARRAYLTAALGICGDPDDDGNSASSGGRNAQKAPSTPSDDMCTDPQSKTIYAISKKLYPDNYEPFQEWLRGGYGTDHTKKLTKAQAREIIDTLKKWEKESEA